MMVVYYETLPTSYLLVLGPARAHAAEADLRQGLADACQSGRPAVWIDCRLLDTLPTQAARLLWALHLRLWRRGSRLLLCRVSEELARQLGQVAPAVRPALHLVPTLDEAARFPVA